MHLCHCQVDSNVTTNENLADVFSLRNALWTWRQLEEEPRLLPGLSLSPEQLFFVAAAQVGGGGGELVWERRT